MENQATTQPARLLKVSMVARLLGVSNGRVYQLIDSQDHPLPAVRLGRRGVRVRQEDWERWLADLPAARGGHS